MDAPRRGMTAGRPLRTVFLLEELGFGGTQRHVIDLVPRLDRATFAPEVWTLAGDLRIAEPLAAAGVRTLALAAGTAYRPTSILRLARQLHHSPPDVLVTYTAIPNIWGRLAGRLALVPLIVGNCRDATPWHQHERWLWRLADHVVCNSAYAARILTDRYRVPPPRVSVIRNGIDLARFDASAAARGVSSGDASEVGRGVSLADTSGAGQGPAACRLPPPAPAHARVILSIGRLVRAKDYPTLLSAFARIAMEEPDVHLWLAGDGPERGRLAALASRPPLAGRVRLLGTCEDVASLLRRATLFVSSSRVEGLPNVLLEAMAARVPIVATAVGGVSEVVRDGIDGRLVAAGDANQLAAAMLALLRDDDARRSMASAARRHVEQNFDVDRMARETSELLCRLAAR